MNYKNVSSLRRIGDFIFFPLRILLKQEWLKYLGLSTLAEERARKVFSYLNGRVLDIGCGENILIKGWGNGIGVDVFPWMGVDIVLDTKSLIFKDCEFDTVTFIASLNHIPHREQTVREAYRVLKPGGTVLITMIGPLVGIVCHALIWTWDPDQQEREMDKDEKWGMTDKEIEEILMKAGFHGFKKKRFGFLWLNKIYTAKK
jgi:SAM-dependent methyltransferase